MTSKLNDPFHFYNHLLEITFVLYICLFFNDCLHYLIFNSVSDKICSFIELNAIKILYKLSPE